MDEQEREIRERLEAVTRVRPEGFIENIGATIAAETFVRHAVDDVEHLFALLDAERERADEAERDRDTARAALTSYHHTSPDEPASWSQAVRDAVRVMVEQAREEERERADHAERERDEWRAAWANLPSWCDIVLTPSKIPQDARERLAPLLAMWMHQVRRCNCVLDDTGRCACARWLEFETWCHVEAAQERGAKAERERIAAGLRERAEAYVALVGRCAQSDAIRAEADRLTSADHIASPASPAHSAQLQTACETLERVACALTDIDPVHPALAGARAVLESCEWTPGGKVGARQRFLDRVDAAGEPPSSILAGRVEAQGEPRTRRWDEHRAGDVWCTPSGREVTMQQEGGHWWETVGSVSALAMTPDEMRRNGWTRVRRGGQQP